MAALVTPAIALVKANRVADAYAPLAEVVAPPGDRGARRSCSAAPKSRSASRPGRAGSRFPVVDTIDALARAAIAGRR